MLSAHEFSVGALANTAPLSLMLPRTLDEPAFVIGHIQQVATAVFLNGQHRFQYIRCEHTWNWKGLIVPSVRIEVDETSVFDTNGGQLPGSIVRTGLQLALIAKGNPGQRAMVELESNLLDSPESSGFSRWQIVIGSQSEKRVLLTIDTKDKIQNHAG